MLCSWRMQTEWSSDPPQYQVFMPTNGYLYSVSSRLFVLGATEFHHQKGPQRALEPLPHNASTCYWYNPPVEDNQT